MTQDLGRRKHEPDRELDAQYPARALLPRRVTTPYRYWFERLNQDQTGGTCVANTAYHMLTDSPLPWRGVGLDAAFVAPSGFTDPQSDETGFRGLLYYQAQRNDPWPDTPPFAGTDFNSAAKVMRSWGLISEWRWCFTVDEVVNAILTIGPVALGTRWPSAWMKNPGPISSNASSRVYLHDPGPTPTFAGGHEICLSGCNTEKQTIRIQTWGGRFWMTFAVLDRCLREWDGDAAVMLEEPFS